MASLRKMVSRLPAPGWKYSCRDRTAPLSSHCADSDIVEDMQYRRLGQHGPEASALGLGCMSIGIADVYTSSAHDDDAAIALVHRALDLDITLLDTADIYGVSELQVGMAIRGRRDQVVLATKFGFAERSSGKGRQASGIDGSPEHVREACDASLRRLGVDHIGSRTSTQRSPRTRWRTIRRWSRQTSTT